MHNDSPTMLVRDFIALKDDPSFEGFACERFSEFEYFEELVDELENAGLGIKTAVVQLIGSVRDEERRLYADVLFIPLKKKFSYDALAILMGSRPDEFGLSRDEKFMRLWWD